MIADVIDDAARFEALAGAWARLAADSAADPLFLSWDWLFLWWKHLAQGRALRLLAARDGGELVAVAPLALRPARLGEVPPFPVIEFLGTGAVGSDYLDVIARRGCEAEALAAIAERLAEERRVVVLAQVARDGAIATGVADALRARGWADPEVRQDLCPYVALDGCSWEGYLASLGAEHRSAFRRKLRRLESRHELRFAAAATEAQRRLALDALFRLHARRWRGRGEAGAFGTRAVRAFHDELSRRALADGWLRLFLLTLDGRPAAALYGFRRGPTFYFYQSGFDPDLGAEGVGVVAMGLAIRAAIDEGAARFDMLHGDEAYKLHWARASRVLSRRELYPPGVRGRLWLGAARAVRRARRVARRLLRRA